MLRKKFIALFTLILIAILGVGCGILSSGSDNSSSSETGEVNESGEDEEIQKETTDNGGESNNNDSMNKENTDQSASNKDNDQNDSSDSEPSSNDENDLPETIELNKRIQHPNGVTLTIESIDFSDDYISVDFEVLNGYGRAIRLAEYIEGESPNKEGAILVDDTGYEYRYSGPDDNLRLLVDSEEKMNGTLVFVGQLSEDADTLTLTFNPGRSEDEKDTDYPKFEFKDIPIER